MIVSDYWAKEVASSLKSLESVYPFWSLDLCRLKAFFSLQPGVPDFMLNFAEDWLNCKLDKIPASILWTAGATSISARFSNEVAWYSRTTALLCNDIQTPRPELTMRYTERCESWLTTIVD